MARYLVNEAGRVESVNDADFAQHMQNLFRRPTDEQPNGYVPREATADEIAAWHKAQGLELLPDGRARRVRDGAIWSADDEAFIAPDAPVVAASESGKGSK